MRRVVISVLLSCVLAAPALASGEGKGDEGGFLKTKYGVTLYGYLKLDVAWDDSRVNTGNFARWVSPEQDNPDDEQFSMTANQTRLGLKFDTEDRHEVRTRGRVEIDFYGQAAAENKAEPFLRHAYMELEWEDKGARLLAGQTSDIISPLVPPTVNYTVNWWVGDIGYRRPQLRYTQRIGDAARFHSMLQLGIMRNIGHSDPFEAIDTGQDRGRPVVQARIGVIGPMGGQRTGGVGLSGHYGKEEYDIAADGSSVDLESWSLNLDLKLPINERVTFTGEYFVGRNLDAYLGGIGKGVTVPDVGEPVGIDADGGWMNLGFKASDTVSLNLGGGVDDPDDEDLASGDRSKNSNVFGNVWWQVTPATKLGFELSHFDTDYLDAEDADAMRFQTAFMFSF